jgi:hypothetical protein
MRFRYTVEFDVKNEHLVAEYIRGMIDRILYGLAFVTPNSYLSTVEKLS